MTEQPKPFELQEILSKKFYVIALHHFGLHQTEAQEQAQQKLTAEEWDEREETPFQKLIPRTREK